MKRDDNKVETNKTKVFAGPMLNVYPDSLGSDLSGLVNLLNDPRIKGAFQSAYILPSIFNTDLDRGFSVIDYDLNELLAKREDLDAIAGSGIDFKFDFILNHASVLSKPFQDIIRNGKKSKYVDFFIDWNKFWENRGQLNEEGAVVPDEKYLKEMFFRKPGLPILFVRMPDGEEVPYWNTFYQEVNYKELTIADVMAIREIQYPVCEAMVKSVNEQLKKGLKPNEIDFSRFEKYKQDVVDLLESGRTYLGQMDLNIKSPLVWAFYEETLRKLASYGAKIVRLDAFAYAPKAPGEKNFLNDPGTWELLEGVKKLADHYQLNLLPEIHSKYEEKIHNQIAQKDYMTYDFFLPGLIIDALENKSNRYLLKWIDEILSEDIKTVNMLGCHDGIPLLDLKGLLTDERIESLIKIVVDRGGHVKDLHGKKNIYYQVNATYFSALGEDERKLLLARCIQIFMPGKPQVWYLDLFPGKNDYKALEQAGASGHKEINRTNLSLEQIEIGLENPCVLKQIELLQFRNHFPGFGFDAKLTVLESTEDKLKLQWENAGCMAVLDADLVDYSYTIVAVDEVGTLTKLANLPHHC